MRLDGSSVEESGEVVGDGAGRGVSLAGIFRQTFQADRLEICAGRLNSGFVGVRETFQELDAAFPPPMPRERARGL